VARRASSARPRSGEQAPALTVQVARRAIRRGRQRSVSGWAGCGTARTSPTGTRETAALVSPLPSWPPVCVQQSLLGLSDRQAAQAVRCRLHCKYAPVMELDTPGFHHSVPANLHERLTHDNRADRLRNLTFAGGQAWRRQRVPQWNPAPMADMT
jgi:hypothetical protein